AMINLIKKDLINPQRILNTKKEELAELIKPSGYFNQKTKKIKNLAKFITKNPISELENLETKKLREVLLSINGVGEETADSIILYALNKPIPVVDAYTKRIFSRIGFTNKNASYKEVQDYQTKNFENEPYHLQELHALLVVLAKEYCTKNNPDCFMCAIYEECKKNI
ncbi:hypothetical protein GOV05_03910, partial [Candidatus Woesearchaeota archaeon]|nr:hypothetical protein [Candidatus Woesearchaeota archaeon]